MMVFATSSGRVAVQNCNKETLITMREKVLYKESKRILNTYCHSTNATTHDPYPNVFCQSKMTATRKLR
jgi:hypothetical protein